MNTQEILNLMNIIKLRDNKNSIENGKVITCNNDSTYNVLITGTSGELYKISAVDDNVFITGDNVLVGYPFESSKIPAILGISPVEIPEEEEVVIRSSNTFNIAIVMRDINFKNYKLQKYNQEGVLLLETLHPDGSGSLDITAFGAFCFHNKELYICGSYFKNPEKTPIYKYSKNNALIKIYEVQNNMPVVSYGYDIIGFTVGKDGNFYFAERRGSQYNRLSMYNIYTNTYSVIKELTYSISNVIYGVGSNNNYIIFSYKDITGDHTVYYDYSLNLVRDNAWRAWYGFAFGTDNNTYEWGEDNYLVQSWDMEGNLVANYGDRYSLDSYYEIDLALDSDNNMYITAMIYSPVTTKVLYINNSTDETTEVVNIPDFYGSISPYLCV